MINFEFNGISSIDKGVIVTKFENNNTLLSRTIVTGEKNRFRPRENHFGALYDQNYSFTLGLSKNTCDTDYNDDFFTSNEVKRINSWLTSPHLPKMFKFIDDDYFDEPIEFFVVISEVSAEHITMPHELIYTVQCDSPYGYTPLIKQKITSKTTIPEKLVLTNNSDELEDYVYPTFKILPKSHSDIVIKNITDNGTLTIKSLRNDEFYIDCQKLKIYDTTNALLSFEDLGIADVDSIYWPRLCSGQNAFEFLGDADIEISWREPRKVGAF